MKQKSREDKAKEYAAKYSQIPKDYDDRLAYLVANSNISESKMMEVINKIGNAQANLVYYNYKIVLFENPEGAKRPRFRLVNRGNYMNLAKGGGGDFIHVYSPNAAEDHKFMHRMLDDELYQLNWFIQTPCRVKIDVYFKTPSYFSKTDTILAEVGLHRHIQKPDWDNIGKKYTDMFNANLWLDDNLVMDGEVHKYYSILPRVEIFIQYLNCVTSVQQYNQIVNRKDYRSEYPIGYLDNSGNCIYGKNM